MAVFGITFVRFLSGLHTDTQQFEVPKSIPSTISGSLPLSVCVKVAPTASHTDDPSACLPDFFFFVIWTRDYLPGEQQGFASMAIILSKYYNSEGFCFIPTYIVLPTMTHTLIVHMIIYKVCRDTICPKYTIHTIHTVHTIHTTHTIHTIHITHTVHTIHTIPELSCKGSFDVSQLPAGSGLERLEIPRQIHECI